MWHDSQARAKGMGEKWNVQAWTSTYPAAETTLLPTWSTPGQLWHVGTKAATTHSYNQSDF